MIALHVSARIERNVGNQKFGETKLANPRAALAICGAKQPIIGRKKQRNLRDGSSWVLPVAKLPPRLYSRGGYN